MGDHVSGPDRAIGSLCACVCMSATVERVNFDRDTWHCDSRRPYLGQVRRSGSLMGQTSKFTTTFGEKFQSRKTIFRSCMQITS